MRKKEESTEVEEEAEETMDLQKIQKENQMLKRQIEALQTRRLLQNDEGEYRYQHLALLSEIKDALKELE